MTWPAYGTEKWASGNFILGNADIPHCQDNQH